jgi:hypothetical protein
VIEGADNRRTRRWTVGALALEFFVRRDLVRSIEQDEVRRLDPYFSLIRNAVPVSVPTLTALLLQVFYGIRSERQLMEPAEQPCYVVANSYASETS